MTIFLQWQMEQWSPQIMFTFHKNIDINSYLNKRCSDEKYEDDLWELVTYLLSHVLPDGCLVYWNWCNTEVLSEELFWKLYAKPQTKLINVSIHIIHINLSSQQLQVQANANNRLTTKPLSWLLISEKQTDTELA